MAGSNTNNKLIFHNTLMLYIRQFLVMGIVLYMSRLVLQMLGVIDFGIYNLVGGVVSVMGVLSGSMSGVCQRYYAIDLGRQNSSHLNTAFNASLIIYLVISVLVFIVMETLGLWLLHHKLDIPYARLYAAEIVLHLSILSFVFTIMQTPFTAMIIASEKMSIYAKISVFEALMKLILIIGLLYVDMDKLILYSIMMTLISALVMVLYIILCCRTFCCCHLKRFNEYHLIKEMLTFTSWNFISSVSSALYNQGTTILLNLFFGPLANAGGAIAAQVSGAVRTFAEHSATAFQPQLIKNFASEDYKDMYSQLYTGMRISYLLLFILLEPLSLRLGYVLELWLGQIPAYAVSFSFLALVAANMEVTVRSLDTLAQATGNIRLYQLVNSVITFANFPLTYFFLSAGALPETPYVVYLILYSISLVARLWILKRILPGFNYKDYWCRFLLPVLMMTLLSVFLACLMNRTFSETFVGLLLFSVATGTVNLGAAYWVLCSNSDRTMIKKILKHFIERFDSICAQKGK